MNGVKANYGTMGLNAKVLRGDCSGQNNVTAHTESIAKWAQDKGMATGFVTTSRVTHASPGGLYARRFIFVSLRKISRIKMFILHRYRRP